ncbi:MAG: arginine--tRNA ligase [Thermoleophilia bacterium]
MPDSPLLAEIRAALAEEAEAVAGSPPPAVPLAPPASPEMGDVASPLAMSLARAAKRPPREIAEAVAERLRSRGGAAWLDRVEVAGPGFINITLAPTWFAAAAARVVAEGEAYGSGGADEPLRILLEYVSANPTGPLHVGHARQAAYGDSLGRVLSFAGHAVQREYYLNDHGRQMRLFGASVAARYAQLFGVEAEIPEGGYHGDYVIPIARAVRDEAGDTLMPAAADPPDELVAWFGDRGRELMLASIRAELTRFRVGHDSFFSETTLHENGAVTRGIEALLAAGDAYEAEGAVWFRASAYGDEKDRVLVRADGEPTYLAADVAYHLDKASRGDDRLIDVLGADHHGYIARLRAVLAAGGHDPDMLEVSILQLVSLLERGEARKMSKRAGTVVTLGDLIDDIGVDAARFFLVQRSHETALDLDLDLAREQSQENPVYYVQYAHARVCSILAQIEAETEPAPPAQGPPAVLDPAERALVMRLADWPIAAAEAAERRAPHRVAAYLVDLARDFHAFYHRCRVVGEPADVRAFRLDCCLATGGVVRRGLGLLGVEAPDRM